MNNFSLYINSIDEDLDSEESLLCKIKAFSLQCLIDINDINLQNSSVIAQFRLSLIKKFCGDLEKITEEPTQMTHENLQSHLSILLFQNWEKTKHSPCSPLSSQDTYTALLYTIARYCSLGSQIPWLYLMMPGVCLESLSENYPDLTSMSFIDICQKFVLSKNGRYLIPVKILSTIELGLPLPQFPQYYLDISSETAESDAYLCDEDVASLAQHSQVTSKIFSIAEQYQKLISDPIAQSFQGLLQRLIKNIRHISIEQYGDEYHAAEGSYADISHFSEAYDEILKKHEQQIPETLKKTLSTIFYTLSSNDAHAHARQSNPGAICASALKEDLTKCFIDPVCQQALIQIESPNNQQQLTALQEEFKTLKQKILAQNYAGNQKNDIDLTFLASTGISLVLTRETIPHLIKALSDTSLYNIFSCSHNYACVYNILSKSLVSSIFLTSNPKQIAAFSQIFSSSFFKRDVITNLEQLQSNLDYLGEYPSKAEAFLANSNCLLSAIFEGSATENVLDFLSRLPAYQLTVVLKELWPSLGIKSLCSNMQQFNHWVNFFSSNALQKKVFIDNCANLFEHVSCNDPLFNLRALPESLQEHFFKLVFESPKILPTIIAKRPRVLKALSDEKFITMLSTLSESQRLSLLTLAFDKAPQNNHVCSSSSSTEYDDTQALISFINLFSAKDVGQLIQNTPLSTPHSSAQALKDKSQALFHPSLIQKALEEESTQAHLQKLLAPVISPSLALSRPQSDDCFGSNVDTSEIYSFLLDSEIFESGTPNAQSPFSEKISTPVRPVIFPQPSSSKKRSSEINDSSDTHTKKIARQNNSNKKTCHTAP